MHDLRHFQGKQYYDVHTEKIFNLPVRIYRKSYCTTPGASGCVSRMLKFCLKVFYMMDKALSDELSCMLIGLVQDPNS